MRAARCAVALVSLAALALVGCSSPAQRQLGSDVGSLAFVDVSVIPMTEEAVLRAQTVLVDEGRITAVGPADSVELPADALRIDGTGKYLVPGFVDMHVHLEHFDNENQLLLFIANGVTTVRNMDGRESILAWRDRQRTGELVAPLIFTSGPLLDGDPPLWDDSVVVSTPADAERIVNSLAEAGYDQLKVYEFLTAEALEAIVEAGRSRGMKIVGHVPSRAGLARALELEQDSIEHLSGYGSFVDSEDSELHSQWHPHKRFLALLTPDDAALDRAVELTAAAGSWNCPTLVMHEKSFVTKSRAAAWKHEPGAESVSGLRRLKWAFVNLIERETAESETVEAARRLRNRIVHQLEEAGAGLLMGTDAGIPFVIPGFSAREELQLLVGAGLTPYQALLSATADAGRFLGPDARVGSIEPGQRADLQLLAASPLADIANISRLEGVLASGTWYDAEDLEQLLDAATW